MIDGLVPISLKELKTKESIKAYNFKGNLDNFPTITPIEGELDIEHKGDYLIVKGFAETTVSLVCDRCLVEYSERLNCNNHEYIWIGQSIPKKDQAGLLISCDEIIDFIEPDGIFDPAAWVFEQLHLQLPVSKICGKECQGSEILKENAINYLSTSKNMSQTDSRWDDLKKLL